MAVLGQDSVSGYPGVIDTSLTYADIASPDPDDNTRVDAAFANSVMSAITAIEASVGRLGTANIWTASQKFDFNPGDPSLSVDNGNMLIGAPGGVKLEVGAASSSPYGSWLQSKRPTDDTAWPLMLNPVGGNVSIGVQNPSGAALLNLNAVPSTGWTISGANPSSLVVIANDGTYDLAVGSGIIILHPSNADYRPIIFAAGGGLVSIVSDAGNYGSVTAGTASKYNVYYNAGTGKYRVENKRGASRDIFLTLIMTRSVS